MRKIYRFLVVTALVCSSLLAKAQNDGLGMTFLPQIPYMNYYNPGIAVPYNGMFGIMLSNFNYSMYNSSLKYDNLFGNDETIIDGVKFVESLKNNNVLNNSLSLDFLNVGFRVKKLFFNIDLRMRMMEEFGFSKDFVGFFVYGNGHYMGDDNPCNFNLGLDLSVYHELGISAQYSLNDKLTFGIRPKLLSGVANATFDNENTKIYTDPETYAISADVDLNVHMASLLEGDIHEFSDVEKMIDSIKVSDMLDFGENLGFGIDFGASYKFNNNFGVAAGIYDLGFIKWTDAKVKKVHKTDVTINDALFDDYHDLTTMELDFGSMLEDLIDEVWGDELLENGAQYKTYLRTRFMVQGYYEYNPMLRATALAQMYIVKGKIHPALTLAYSGNFWNCLNLTVNYTMSNYTGSSLGAGLGLHVGPFNFFAVTDNILTVTKLGKPITELASAYKTANARLGIVWTIGKYKGANKQEVEMEEFIIEDTESDETESFE